MTTPNVTSPNVRIIERGRPVPEGAEPSETPLAELLLADFPRVRDHYAERDVLGALENVPVIITIAARAGWAALAQDISDATESGRLLLADWWRHAWTETFQRPAFWSAPALAPDPGAHPYPAPEAEPVAAEPAPAAEPEPAAGEPEPATDATAVLLSMAKPEEEGEPADATAVMEPPTQIVPAVEKDGGESDAS